MQELERRLEALETEHAREIEALDRQVEALTTALETADQAVVTQAPNVFNPAVSVMGTFLGRVDDMRAFEEDDPNAERIDDRMTLREAEVDLRAPISPWAEGVLIVELEAQEGGHEAGVEEGYVTLGRLPLMDTTPGGLRLKAGHFRTDFGRLNQVHVHDLPQPTSPRSMALFMGSDGYIETGVSGQFFLPTGSDTLSLEGTLEVLNGGGLPPQSTGSTSDTALLGQLRTFAEFGDASTFDLGVSAWSDGSERTLYGIDATYQWVPPSQGTWQSFVLGSELFLGDFEQVGLDDNPRGGYVYAQYQFDTWTYCGARYDHSQELDDASIETDAYMVYVTRYAAEFLRFRLAYERADSDLALIDGRDTVFLEISFVYGVYPIDPYWVHR